MKHTGEKPFSCQFCQYSAIRKSQLDDHTKAKHQEMILRWKIK